MGHVYQSFRKEALLLRRDEAVDQKHTQKVPCGHLESVLGMAPVTAGQVATATLHEHCSLLSSRKFEKVR